MPDQHLPKSTEHLSQDDDRKSIQNPWPPRYSRYPYQPDLSEEDMTSTIKAYGNVLPLMPFLQLSPLDVDALEVLYCEGRQTPMSRHFLPDALAPTRLINLGVQLTETEILQVARKMDDIFPEAVLQSETLCEPTYLMMCISDSLRGELLCEYPQYCELISLTYWITFQCKDPKCLILVLHPIYSWPHTGIQSARCRRRHLRIREGTLGIGGLGTAVALEPFRVLA
ncbi:hypothetical protein GY45DRAFT_1329478 [Cubamyces sp. BRFM 1775]|nr:hypothetical protein GY45DRAFT_1329478 [Cubamyces sp. BRFM 1775]